MVAGVPMAASKLKAAFSSVTRYVAEVPNSDLGSHLEVSVGGLTVALQLLFGLRGQVDEE